MKKDIFDITEEKDLTVSAHWTIKKSVVEKVKEHGDQQIIRLVHQVCDEDAHRRERNKAEGLEMKCAECNTDDDDLPRRSSDPAHGIL